MKSEINLTREQIIEALNNSKTIGGAASFLKICRRTFKKEALKFDLYKLNKRTGQKYNLIDILNGLHPDYPTSHLSKRLVKEGIKEYKCQGCEIKEYNGKHISLELNHIDGNSANHNLVNLELLCPNCHSQTDTYRSKKLLLKK